MTDKKECTSCIFCVHQDVGYSNWTVEGTETECLFDLVMEADKCPHFTEGSGIYFDVDGEENVSQIIAWREQYIKTKDAP